MKETVLLLDANSILHRAFHALPPLTDKENNPCGAVYGTLLVFFRILDDVKPNYLAAAFDFPGKCFRHKKYKEYKAQRPKTPQELSLQIEKMKKVFSDMGVIVLEKEGMEADDLVGTIACQVPKGSQTVIASGDKDLFQLIDEKTKVYSLSRGVKEGIFYDKAGVRERYGGLSPGKIIDVKALQGDPSDNVPGVAGIGEKTAIQLIHAFGNLDHLYASLERGDHSLTEKISNKLKEQKKEAFLSRELVTIKKDIPLHFEKNKFRFSYDKKKIYGTLKELGFDSLTKRFTEEEKEIACQSTLW